MVSGAIALLLAASAAASALESIVLENVTVIDGTGAAPQARKSIVIEGGKIASIAPAGTEGRIPKRQTIDLKGAFVLPGLIDGHVHVIPWRERDKKLERLLRTGVTTVREMGGDARITSALAERARSGTEALPNIYYVATFFGPSFLQDRRVALVSKGHASGEAPWMRTVTAESDLPAMVAGAKKAGVAGIKLYSEVAPDLSKRIVDEAHRQGLKVWSHATIFPSKPSDAVAAGVDTIVHSGMLFPELRDDLPNNYHVGTRQWMAKIDFSSAKPDAPRMLALFKEMKRKGTIYEPTLAGSERFEANNAAGTVLGNIDWEGMRAWGCAATGIAHRAGVTISAGTDTAGGAPVQRELELLVGCGLSPMDAIVAATRNSAKSIGIEKTHGTIEPGKAADLLVVSADPIAAISNIRKVVMTLKDGRIIEPQSIQPAEPVQR